MLNYVEKIRHELRARISDYDDWGEDAGTLLDLYALLVITKGEQTTLEDIHDSWSLWTNRTRPDHRSLVPFGHLTADIAEYDRPYMAAVHEVSAMLSRARLIALDNCREDAATLRINRSQKDFEREIWRTFDTLTKSRIA